MVTSCGGDRIAERVSEKLGISKEEAKEVIVEKGFQVSNNPVMPTLGEEIEELINETRNAIACYNQETGRSVEKVILSGGNSLLFGIDVIFQSYFDDLEVKIGDPLKKVGGKEKIPKEKSVLYSDVIGLALRSTLKDPVKEGVNLLPEEIRRKERKVHWQQEKRRVVIMQAFFFMVMFVAIMLVVLYFLGYLDF